MTVSRMTIRTAACLLVALCALPLPAQEDPNAPVEEVPLLDREAFDIIVLDEANKNYVAELVVGSFPGRAIPPADKRKGHLRVRLVEDDIMQWDVEWAHIVNVILFERMLFDKAKALRGEGKAFASLAQPQFREAEAKLDESWMYFMRMKREYPRYPNLEKEIDHFLWEDSVMLYKSRRFAEALSVMEQLFDRNPNYNSSLARGMDRLVSVIVNDYLAKQDFRSARVVLDRLADKYQGKKPQTIDALRNKLDALAAEKVAEGQKLLDLKKYREAVETVREARDISPRFAGARDLEQTLATTYPQIIVGVTQPAATFDSERIDDWAARRTGRLVHRTLIEFLGAGNEGGEYAFPGGVIDRSPDGRTLTFRLNQFSADNADVIPSGYELSRRLLDLGNPRSPEYRPAWASLITGVAVNNVLQVDVDIRRSHVLPQSLLRVPMTSTRLPDGTPAKTGTGSFQVDVQTDSEVRFMLKGFQPRSRLAELIERRFDNANAALNALRRGRIDVIDRLFPSDAVRLQEQLKTERNPDLVLQQYALPTVHMLIPKSDDPYLQNKEFRRALAFGIDRQRILGEDLLGGEPVPGCEVISGPFPLGLGETDPLAYAYDETLDPRVWRPRLGKLLTILAEKQLTTHAEKLKKEPPKLKPLLLAHPATESARVACQAIKAHLAIIDIKIETKELPIGMTTDPEEECDLLYAEIAIWEPVSDARKLLGPTGVASTDSPFVQQALRRLNAAENWGDVRDELVALHRAAHNEVAIIPLWQTTDSFVYNKRLRNLGENPVWLYQNVDQWRLQAEVAER